MLSYESEVLASTYFNVWSHVGKVWYGACIQLPLQIYIFKAKILYLSSKLFYQLTCIMDWNQFLQSDLWYHAMQSQKFGFLLFS
jgi:hypothetical protein